MLQGKPLLGVTLVITATLLFAINDATNKYLLVSYDVPLVAAIRNIVHAILMIAILGPYQGHRLVQSTRPGLVIIRSVCLTVGTLFAGLALQLMPIAETTAIIYLSPIIVVLLARPILGESIGIVGWLAALGGFAGVVLIARPGGGLDPLGVIFALCNVGATVSYYLLTRILAKSERTLTLLFYSALIGAILFGLAMPWFWFGAMPSNFEIILFLSLGVTAGLGHFCFTAANRYAPASVLAPMTYSHLLWAGILGWLVFGQLPDSWGLAGMLVIAAAGVAVALRTRFARR
ncbi:permease [Devosia limi DSM 17137]|uniref:Permease n=1 Tax=Devosia limi DSM 17137 TaxID=1121477 RepID=A0A0F5LQ71_9HYPH|nr:permease [Devosia limi DSM 17137]